MQTENISNKPFINAGDMSPEEFADKLRDINLLHSEFKGGIESMKSSLRVQRGELNAALDYVNRGIYFLTTPEIVHPGGHPNVTQEDILAIRSIRDALVVALSTIDPFLIRSPDKPDAEKYQ